MAKKCSICSEKIEFTFLQKPIGTYARDKKGKKHLVCSTCQQTHTIETLKEKL